MEIIGFALGILIGITLGLIGSGGSVLTIPILVYLMHISPSNATTYSLFIVGISALVGSLKGAKDHLLNYKVAFYFGLPSVLSIFIMRYFIVPLLPDKFFTIQHFLVTKDMFIMLLFAFLMIITSFTMIYKRETDNTTNESIDKNKVVIIGIFIGLITGFMGVGGGFLIIPTLVFYAHLPIKKAIATSLMLVALNSLIGFVGGMKNNVIDWGFLCLFTGFAMVGIFLGMFLSKKISHQKLKPAFGWFVLITGIYILWKELS